MPRIAPEMTLRARELRRAATPEERLLWSLLRHHRPRFTRQLPIGRYIVDFACRDVGLVIELDGGQHAEAVSYDSERTLLLNELGWQVLRFWNSEVRDNVEGVAEAIAAAVSSRPERTHPRPLPFREGRSRKLNGGSGRST